MSANAKVIDLVKGNSTLVRPRFSPGLLLRDDDLTLGLDYTRDLSRLLFRSLIGCGVVCGLEVVTEVRCGKLLVTVKQGVALDAMGDPIQVPDPMTITIDPTCGKEVPPRLWVSLCHTRKCCEPRTAVCGCDEEEDDGSVCTREREGFEIRLLGKTPQSCACMCDERLLPSRSDDVAEDEAESWLADPCGCLKDHYAGKCTCACCDPECVVLAVLTDVSRDNRYDGPIRKEAEGEGNPWIVNHSVRRFIRPVLMRDPLVFAERYRRDPCAKREPPEEKPEPEGIQEVSVLAASSQAAQDSDGETDPGNIFAVAYRTAVAEVDEPEVTRTSDGPVRKVAAGRKRPARTKQP